MLFPHSTGAVEGLTSAPVTIDFQKKGARCRNRSTAFGRSVSYELDLHSVFYSYRDFIRKGRAFICEFRFSASEQRSELSEILNAGWEAEDAERQPFSLSLSKTGDYFLCLTSIFCNLDDTWVFSRLKTCWRTEQNRKTTYGFFLINPDHWRQTAIS